MPPAAANQSLPDSILERVVESACKHLDDPMVQKRLRKHILKPVLGIVFSEVQVYVYGLAGFMLAMFVLVGILVFLLMVSLRTGGVRRH